MEITLKTKTANHYLQFLATLWGLRGNMCTSYVAHWKALARLSVSDN